MLNKKVLIVIGLYKAKEYLEDLINSLDKITYPLDKYKIYIVDDKSPDDTYEELERLVEKSSRKEQYIIEKAQENGGFCVNYNRGLQKAIDENFDYVYMLNQDTAVKDDFIDRIIEVMEDDKEIGIAQSKIVYFKDPTIINSYGNFYHYLGFAYAGGNLEKDNGDLAVREISYPSGAGMMLRVELLKEIGLMEEFLWMYHDDVYMGLLTHYYGKKVVIVPSSVVYHKYEFESSIGRIDFMERNRFLILLWFYNWWTLLVILPALILMEFGQWGFAFMRGWAGKRWQGIKFFFSLKNWKDVLRIRKRIQKLKKRSDREVLRRWAVGTISHQEINNWVLKYIANPFFASYWFVVKYLFIWF